MTELIKKDDPQYFQQNDYGDYDRHHYKIVCATKSLTKSNLSELWHFADLAQNALQREWGNFPFAN